MKQERVSVMVGTHQRDSFDFDVCYKDHKDLISKTKDKCKRRYNKYCLLGIFLEDGTYLHKERNGWCYVDNRLPNEIVTLIQ